MSLVPAIGAAVVFSQGFGEFLAEHSYAIVAVNSDGFLLVDIDLKNRSAARILRNIERAVFINLEKQGLVKVKELPTIPRTKNKKKAETGANGTDSKERVSWAYALKPMIDAAPTIFADKDPVRKFNEMARAAKLHTSRARERFFWLAAYSLDEECLLPAYWNGGAPLAYASTEKTLVKRGRKVKDPSITPVGWPYDPAWEKLMLDGWNKHSKPGKSYMDVYVDTLRTKFGCLCDATCRPARLYQPDGKSFPTRWQFKNFIQKTIGLDAWRAAKHGEQTIRNHAGEATEKVAQYLINLLEEVQWDAQILDERPGDLLDPSQPGKPIVRVVAICATCGGPVGVGYDYGAESQWAYLMALLCMAMKKSDFGALFGVEISDKDWPAVGLMLAIRGDRGPAIGQKVSDLIGKVLEIWQEWAASYDPVGKANAESGHHKTIKVEGAPRTPRKFRTPMEIIREDLRKTVIKFRSADMSHRLDPEQARRLDAGTPLAIWNDLVNRRLYAGQYVPVQKMIRLTVPSHPVSITHDGVYLGGVRYLSPELEKSGVLERARGHAIASNAYALHMTTRCIWLDINGELMQLTGVPVRINAMDSTHSMTLEESMHYQEQINNSRRAIEQEQIALNLHNKIETEKDSQAINQARSEKPPHKSTGKRQTANQHETVLKRKT